MGCTSVPPICKLASSATGQDRLRLRSKPIDPVTGLVLSAELNLRVLSAMEPLARQRAKRTGENFAACMLLRLARSRVGEADSAASGAPELEPPEPIDPPIDPIDPWDQSHWNVPRADEARSASE